MATNQTSKNTSKAIVQVLKYFHFFSYAPTFDEIYTFLPIKISKKKLTSVLREMVRVKKIQGMVIEADTDHFELTQGQKYTIYAMRGEGIFLSRNLKKRKITLEKLYKMKFLLKIIQKVPSIHLIGLSGSCTMGNAREDDDVDFFIITAPNRIWTARFTIICIAFLIGKKRSRNRIKAPNKACFNMFFDSQNLHISSSKQNIYTAHEVLQMKPIALLNNPKLDIDASYQAKEKRLYKQFISANNWVSNFFPNYDHAGIGIKTRYITKGQNNLFISNALESLLRIIQLSFINRHKTKEIITNRQLWFFPRDFEVKMKNFIPKVARQSQ